MVKWRYFKGCISESERQNRERGPAQPRRESVAGHRACAQPGLRTGRCMAAHSVVLSVRLAGCSTVPSPVPGPAFLRKGCLCATENHEGRPHDEGRKQPHAPAAALFPPPAVSSPWGQTGRRVLLPAQLPSTSVSSAGSRRDTCPQFMCSTDVPQALQSRGQQTTACGPRPALCLFL